MPEGFALDEYLTPRNQHQFRVPGGTMPKAPNDHGSMFANARKIGTGVPGPGQYDMDRLNQKKWSSAGNTFTKLERDAHPRLRTHPAVGQYQTTAAMVLTSPRIQGGPLPKGAKGSALTDNAVRKSRHMPDPGKYSPSNMHGHIPSLTFNPSKTASKSVPPKVPPGPGTYEPSFEHVEPRIPAYTSSKEASKSHLDGIQREKAKIPAPGFVGIPDPKNVDRHGTFRHTQKLLQDR
mmetsp:Transcript_103590/g.322807  ORF Transcript_103590/g.322807 Transcript_103590/m.322807 type:complete len:235 (+) Transcript_103590:112-816(+)